MPETPTCPYIVAYYRDREVFVRRGMDRVKGTEEVFIGTGPRCRLAVGHMGGHQPDDALHPTKTRRWEPLEVEADA